MNRLPAPFGSRIDRSRRIRFTFEGKSFEGYEGDSIASALAASGQWVLSRSFKYHRPRGILSAGAEEPNALVQIVRDDARKTPNVRATVQELYDGLARSEE
ncbi:sarcosine oxidase subunit alpha, partial [Mesorhizobium sp. M2D.F.Ca.ET.160.01.1.1]